MVVTIVFWGLLCGAVLTTVGFLMFLVFRELDLSLRRRRMRKGE